MFENSLVNQIRNNGINADFSEAEIVVPENINFLVCDAQCTVGFKPSEKRVGKYLAVLTANINGATLSNRYGVKSPSEEELENAKQILTKSVTALKRILGYNVNVNQNEEGKIVASFDWETYNAFKEECSFGEFLPEQEQSAESENESENEEDSSDNSSCIVNLKNADELESFADYLDETFKEVVNKFAKDKLFVFTVELGKKEISYISDTNIQQDGVFIYFENNLTSDEYARKVADVTGIKKSQIPSYETEMLKKVIFA